jgi:hypothetical protein
MDVEVGDHGVFLGMAIRRLILTAIKWQYGGKKQATDVRPANITATGLTPGRGCRQFHRSMK